MFSLTILSIWHYKFGLKKIFLWLQPQLPTDHDGILIGFDASSKYSFENNQDQHMLLETMHDGWFK